MQLMELRGEKKTGINGEKVTLSDWWDLLQKGLPAAVITMLFSEEGRGLTNLLLGKNSGQECTYMVMPLQLSDRSQEAEQIARRIEQIAAETEAAGEKLKGCLKYGFLNSIGISKDLKRESGEIEKTAGYLKKMAAVMDTAAGIYTACEQSVADI